VSIFFEKRNTGPYNLERAAAREIKRYLKLHHIRGGDSSIRKDSDEIEDAPNQAEPNFNKPGFPGISRGNGSHGDMLLL
jgi:hypothetical protein